MARFTEAFRMVELANICATQGKECPDEWPEGLDAHYAAMVAYVLDMGSPKPKPVKPKGNKRQAPKKEVKANGSKEEEE